MSKKNDLSVVSNETPPAEVKSHVTDFTPPFAAPGPIAKLSDVDRLNLELAKANRRVALAQAKQAMSENESAELSYRYFVLQLYMKYGLSATDVIQDNGEVFNGQSVPPNPQGQ